MFFGKNKTSLKLAKQHPEMLTGAEYIIVESVINPKKIRIGSGISQLMLRGLDGEEYLIEGNSSKIKEYFIPSRTYQSAEGKIFKAKKSFANINQNELLKEVSTCPYDEKMQFGHGIAEHYYIQKSNNKVIKLYGNSHQIKNLIEEVVIYKPIEKKVEVPKTKVEIVERTIIKEQVPVVGEQGQKGERGAEGPAGPRGQKGEPGEIGPAGAEGPRGAKGEKGDKGDKGDSGPAGEQGIQGSQGPRGPKGEKGDKGDKGDRGEIGPMGLLGPEGPEGIPGEKGDPGEVGPQGQIGPQGPRGEKGDQGDRGPMGPQGPVGPRGDVGPAGPPGLDGRSPELDVEYPLVLKENKITLDSKHLDKILGKFKGADTQKIIESIGKLAVPGGGGLLTYFNGTRLNRYTGKINFTGGGVNVTANGQTVNVEIAGGGGPLPEGYVAQIIAGPGISISPTEGIGAVTITNSYGAPNRFTYNTDAPTGATQGDRWMDSDNGIEYVLIQDVSGSTQWVQPTNTGGQAGGGISIVNTTAVTGATYSASTSDYYIGVSYAGPVTITLPTNPETGREIVVKDESGNAGNGVNRQITIVGATASNKIDNQSSAIINLDNAGLHFIYRNGWRII